MTAAPSRVEPFVSVVVPTFNRCASLLTLLRALAGQTYPHSAFEVVVVDDGSTDGTPAAVAALDVPYRIDTITQANRGPGAARNRGVERATGTLILFLDDDVVPRPEVIAEHVAVHRDDPAAVVIGPMSPPLDRPRSAWVRWEEEKLEDQYRALHAGEYPCTPRQFYTGNASVKRERFLDAGGFDEAFLRAEDVELAYRLHDRGATFTYHRRAAVRHYAARSFASWRRAAQLYGRYDVIMQRDKRRRTLSEAASDFHLRHPVNRLVARLCVGRPRAVRAAVRVLGVAVAAADRLRVPRVTSFALSGMFNVLYWQGACEELGDSASLWRTIDENRPVSPTTRSVAREA